MFGTLWFYVAIVVVVLSSFVKLLGVTTPKRALIVALITTGASFLAGSVVSIIAMKYLLKVQNPVLWSSLGKIGLYVGVGNIPYILTLILSLVLYDLLISPVKARFTPRPVAYGNYAVANGGGGLTFGVPTTTTQVLVLDNIGKQAVKNYKMMREKKNVKPVKNKKLDIKSLKNDIPAIIRTTGGSEPRNTPNVWDGKELTDLRSVVLKNTRTNVNPEEVAKRNFERRQRDEIDEIIESGQTETLRVIEDPNEVVMIAYTSLLRHLIGNFNIPPEEAEQEDRYQLLSRRKKGDIWEFVIRYNIDPFTSYDFAVYVDKFGRSEVVLINVS